MFFLNLNNCDTYEDIMAETNYHLTSFIVSFFRCHEEKNVMYIEWFEQPRVAQGFMLRFLINTARNMCRSM